MSDFTAVVFAAGEGSRLHPLTQYRPKPMLPAATRPILEYVFDQLIGAGIGDIVVVVGYGRERVQSHFGSTYRNVPLRYVTQHKQLGTGHALLAAKSVVDGTCLAINGDQIVDRRIIEATIDGHGADAAATVGLVHHPDVGNYGGVILEGNRVREIVERPKDDREYLLNAGVYALEPHAFEAVRAAEPRDGERLLVDGLLELVEANESVRGVVSDGLWVDVTYPWDLLPVSFELFDTKLVGGKQGESVSRTATVHDSAVIRDPVVIADDCEIGSGAVVGPSVCLGENATVESNAVVEGSVVDADARIGQGATVIDCVTGIGTRIGPGTTIPGGPGDVRVDDRIFKDENLGALLADRVEDRGGVTYVPGAIVGPDVVVETGATIQGTIPEGTEVRL